MAHITSFGLYLLATLLLFLSGVNHSLALTNDAAENIPRAVHTKDPSKEDRLELAIQTMMRVMEDGFARTAREVREIKEVASLKEAITSLKEGMKSLEEGMKSLEDGRISSKQEIESSKQDIQSLKVEMQSSKQAIESLENKLSHAVDTITSSVVDIKNKLNKAIPSSRNCHDLLQRGHSTSGEYSVTIFGKNVTVYCDMTTDGGGWTVIQRRDDIWSHEDFNRDWEDYKKGFGHLEGEFWLGLDNIHGLTSSDPSHPMMLRVDLEDWEGEKRVALYHTFRVRGEEERYNLTVGGYEKGPGGGDPGDSLAYHNGRAFSTKDRDNDDSRGVNCAERSKGGWWYYRCLYSNLNGLYLKGEHGQYQQGVIWHHWKGSKYSLRRAAMKIRPR